MFSARFIPPFTIRLIRHPFFCATVFSVCFAPPIYNRIVRAFADKRFRHNVEHEQKIDGSKYLYGVTKDG